MSAYRIPKNRTRVEIRVSNSRFITTIAPAFSAQEAHDFIRSIRAEMPDATHHVYAFKIGYGASVQEGMSDDGEPSGTAGPPTLAVLRGADVGDLALVTTRYFGGTKLGTGGLVSAYTAAAQAAFEAVETIEKVAFTYQIVDVPYALFEPARRLLAEHHAEITNETFAADVTLTYAIPEERAADFAAHLRNLSAGRITPRTVDPADG